MRVYGIVEAAERKEKVKNGEFTWSDVYAEAKVAKEKGCSEWGLIHRKGSAHPDLIQFIFAFGGTLYDENGDKLVLDVPAVYKWLYVEWKFARDGLLPEDNVMGLGKANTSSYCKWKYSL